MALLAFLGQTWTTAPELRIAAVISIALMVLGMLLAVWGQFQLPELSERRYLKNQSSDALKNYREAQQWHQRRVCLAFVSFALAVIVLLAWAAAVNSLRAAVC